jgi:hypothetical protein
MAGPEDVLNVLAQAPANAMNLMSQQFSQSIGQMNADFSMLASALATPPALPMGMPDLGSLIPGLPGAAAAPAAKQVQANVAAQAPAKVNTRPVGRAII